MSNSVMLSIHIAGGLIGILSGMTSLFVQKGSKLHRKVGNIFYYSMMVMTLSASWMAFQQASDINLTVGLLTFYMVVTGRRTSLNISGRNGWVEYGGLLYILTLFCMALTFSMEVAEHGIKSDGIPAGAYYFFTSIIVIALALDAVMIFRGGVFGNQRLARHLWRMSFALFVACGSFFLGQPQVFPEPVRKPLLLAIPVLVVIFALFYWLIRVLFVKKKKQTVLA